MQFLDSQKIFKECFTNDKEREKYMYMHSKNCTHYFKNIDTREYIVIEKVI